MPYSTQPPPMVMPADWKWQGDCERAQRDGVYVERCYQYRPDHHPLPAGYMFNGVAIKPSETLPCENRSTEGDRRHNWCFRCTAGFILWSHPDDDPWEE